jgi:hypothetical protein
MAQDKAPAVLHPNLEKAVLRLGPLLEHRHHRMAAASEVKHMWVVLPAATRAAQDTDLHLPRSCNLRRNTAIC